MRETSKILIYLTCIVGSGLLIGSIILFYKNANLHGFQFQGDYMGTGKGGQLRAASLSWQGLLILSLCCYGIGGFFWWTSPRGNEADED
ncbi:MAG: hypothetical protein R8P61_15465 [Bacteroidia bacterium]|nr:hypothetical protein [Bacteroidia bacterium]